MVYNINGNINYGDAVLTYTYPEEEISINSIDNRCIRSYPYEKTTISFNGPIVGINDELKKRIEELEKIVYGRNFEESGRFAEIGAGRKF